MFQVEQVAHSIDIGRIGQRIARKYLEKSGYTTIQENVRIFHDEIDILAMKSGQLCIIEVKTRSSQKYETAEYHFSKSKISNLKRAAFALSNVHSVTENISLQGIAIQLNYANKIANIKHFLSLV